MPNALHQVLNQMLKHERWRKKPRVKGILLKKTKTKSGSLKLMLRKRGKKTEENEFAVYVLKKNINLYEKAESAKNGDVISIAGRYWLGKLICEKLDNLGRGNEKYFEHDEKQSKLELE